MKLHKFAYKPDVSGRKTRRTCADTSHLKRRDGKRRYHQSRWSDFGIDFRFTSPDFKDYKQLSGVMLQS